MEFEINGFKINQSVSDLQKGFDFNDFSRISAYSGPDTGVHTGSLSPTIGRHDNLNFGNQESERQTTLQEFGFSKGFTFDK